MQQALAANAAVAAALQAAQNQPQLPRPGSHGSALGTGLPSHVNESIKYQAVYQAAYQAALQQHVVTNQTLVMAQQQGVPPQIPHITHVSPHLLNQFPDQQQNMMHAAATASSSARLLQPWA